MKPEDFPIGSPESRAAARMLLARRNDNCKRMRIIWSIPSPGEDNSRVDFGDWQEWEDNTMGQRVYVPHVWIKPGDTVLLAPIAARHSRKHTSIPAW